MKITIDIKTDNDAFQGVNKEPEVYRIMQKITEDVFAGNKSGVIFDINGNRVGNWTLKD